MWQAVWAIALVFWPSSNPASAVGEQPTLLARETQAQEELAKTVLRTQAFEERTFVVGNQSGQSHYRRRGPAARDADD